MSFDLIRVIRTLLFASNGPLSVKEIQAVFTRFHDQMPEVASAGAESGSGEEGEEAPADESNPGTVEVPSLVTATQIREAMDAISRELTDSSAVCRLIEGHNGYRLVTSPDMAEWVRLLRDEPKPVKLSQAALETLAIIAYRQPVVRAEIESIRGVSVDNALSRLLERELIEVIGRADLPGRPIQYGTSEAFLEFVGLKSLDELPSSDVLSPREIDTWLQRTSEGPEVMDKDIGLPEEGGNEESESEESAPEREGETVPESQAPEADDSADDETIAEFSDSPDNGDSEEPEDRVQNQGGNP